jgi:class 3 adenylate cyclase
MTKTDCLFYGYREFHADRRKMAQVERTNWLNHHLNEMARIVIKYGGTRDKYIGDGVMVFFGDPTSRGPTQNAIQCVKKAQEMIFRTKIMGLNIPIGISTGECTVGNFGSFDRTDYTITGKEVNVACRLEGLAARGRFLISESTYQLVKDEVACQSHGTIQVKGFESSLMTYWVKSGGSTVVPNS